MIRLHDVHKSYGGSPGFDPVLEVGEWSVAAGERVALVGASGSGKTTLLNLLSGLILPDRGQVLIDGVDIVRLAEPARDRFRAANCGYMFQSFHLLEGFSALENVELGASFAGHRVERGQAAELLEAVGLGERLHHRPDQLSIGQQARCALARALMNRPKVLLADEPTGSLDPATAAAVLELLIGTAEAQGTTLVCATHDLGVAEAMGRIERVEELLWVISPLALRPRVPHEARFIYAGTADRLAPPDHARDLWEHWGRPRIAWYEGSHVSFFFENDVKRLIREALTSSGLLDGPRAIGEKCAAS